MIPAAVKTRNHITASVTRWRPSISEARWRASLSPQVGTGGRKRLQQELYCRRQGPENSLSVIQVRESISPSLYPSLSLPAFLFPFPSPLPLRLFLSIPTNSVPGRGQGRGVPVNIFSSEKKKNKAPQNYPTLSVAFVDLRSETLPHSHSHIMAGRKLLPCHRTVSKLLTFDSGASQASTSQFQLSHFSFYFHIHLAR